MAKIIKEIIIILLISLILMLIFAVTLYEYIPNRKVVAEVVTYSASEKIQEQLADNVDEEKNHVVLTYEVTSSDLNSYESKNEYVPGKANPFAVESIGVGDDGTGNITNPGGTTTGENGTSSNNTSNSNGDNSSAIGTGIK